MGGKCGNKNSAAIRVRFNFPLLKPLHFNPNSTDHENKKYRRSFCC